MSVTSRVPAAVVGSLSVHGLLHVANRKPLLTLQFVSPGPRYGLPPPASSPFFFPHFSLLFCAHGAADWSPGRKIRSWSFHYTKVRGAYVWRKAGTSCQRHVPADLSCRSRGSSGHPLFRIPAQEECTCRQETTYSAMAMSWIGYLHTDCLEYIKRGSRADNAARYLRVPVALLDMLHVMHEQQLGRYV